MDTTAEDATAEDATAELFNLGWTLRRSHQILTNYRGRSYSIDFFIVALSPQLYNPQS